MACNPHEIITALHEEKENITDIVYEKINVSDRMVLRKIPDGGVVRRNSNQESIIYGEAHQASMAYRNTDHDPRALEEGQMQGKTVAGQNGIFDTNIQDIDENSCHGFCTIQFGQGFRRRGFEDYQIDVDTPVKCTRELDRQGEAHIRGYFEGFRRHFTKFGMDNFADNLLNLVIQNGEANASVLAADQFNVSTGGWQAPPEYRISIHFLEDYRRYIMAEMEMLAMEVAENWKLEVEMPFDDWVDAVKEHQIRRNSMVNTTTSTALSSVDLKMLEDPEAPMRNRQYHDFGNIRCFFNDRPIRGFYKQVGIVGGNANYEFVRVYHWMNVVGEEGGLVIKPNHDYERDSITVDGVKYDMCTLIPHIHPKSFKRYGLTKPIKPMGEDNLGVNYQVDVADGAYIPNNKANDKFQLIARHEFRFKTKFPEISGFIAYRHGQRLGYVIEVTPRDYVTGPDNFSGPEQYRECDLIDPVTTENCAACDEVPTSDGDCITAADAVTAAGGTVNLDPCGALLTIFDTDEHTVRLAIRRTGDLAAVGSINYATANGTALAGTHYTDTSGTADFAAGQEYAYVEIPITDGSGDVDDDLAFTFTLSTPVGVTAGTCLVSTITIEDITNE